MVIKPGGKAINENGKGLNINSPQEIKSYIEGGLKYDIIDQIKKDDSKKEYLSLEFNAIILKNTNRIEVRYITTNPEDGIKVFELVKGILISKCSEIKNSIKKENDKKIRMKKNELSDFEIQEKIIKIRYGEKLASLKNKSEDLKSKEIILLDYIKNIGVNINNLISSNAFKDNEISESKLLIYQNIQYLQEKQKSAKIDLLKTQREISDVSKIIENHKKIGGHESYFYMPELLNIKKDMGRVSKEIQGIEKETKNIHPIQILQEPAAEKLPKSCRIISNALLAAIVGLFLMLFLSIFLEYIKNYGKNEKSK